MTSNQEKQSLAALHAQHDTSGMLSLAESIAAHLTDARSIGEAFTAQLDTSLRGDAQQVVICGMGGSAIGADMARSWAGAGAAVPLHTWRGYEIPSYLLNRAFGLVSSYSGNTGETLAAERSMQAAGIPRVAVTSGGALRERMQGAGMPFCTIPGGMPPRAAIAYSFVPTVLTLSAFEFVSLPGGELDEAIELAGTLCGDYALASGGGRAAELAGEIHGKLPIIYSCDDLLGAISRRWACQVNENSKSLAHFALFPELCHNEIVG